MCELLIDHLILPQTFTMYKHVYWYIASDALYILPYFKGFLIESANANYMKLYIDVHRSQCIYMVM